MLAGNFWRHQDDDLIPLSSRPASVHIISQNIRFWHKHQTVFRLRAYLIPRTAHSLFTATMTLSSACNTAAGLSAARPLEVRAGSRLRQSAAGAASPAKLRASSFQGTKLSSATISARRAPCSSSRIQAGLGDVAKYLSEAASSIFSVDNSDVPWSGTSSGFQGKVSHHEVARLRSLYNTVKATRERVCICSWPLRKLQASSNLCFIISALGACC